MFERLLALRNDVERLPEEYNPVSSAWSATSRTRFSDVGLINTALNLTGPRSAQPYSGTGPILRAAHDGPATARSAVDIRAQRSPRPLS